MMSYKTPIIEIEKMETEDFIMSSYDDDELPLLPPPATTAVNGGTISGTTGGKITIGGGKTGGFSAGDLFGNR